MQIATIRQATVTFPDDMTEEEALKYLEHVQLKSAARVEILAIETDPVDPEFLGLTYKFNRLPFVRIRRITGYLVGSMDNWNDAKSSEEKDRLKHDTTPAGLETL